jgi:Diacylglycerol kinase catalytic domain
MHRLPIPSNRPLPRTATGAARLLVVVNARASGVEDAERTAAELVALLQELGREADGAVTRTEAGLLEALRVAAATGRRLVLVGGDGSLHAAANAPLDELPELALVPAGRANNIARGLAYRPTGPARWRSPRAHRRVRSTHCWCAHPGAACTRWRPSAPASTPPRDRRTRARTRPTCARACGRSPRPFATTRRTACAR